MGIEQLREMAAEANLGFVPAVFLNKCGPREPLAPEGLSTLVYSNNVHTLAALAAHTGLRSGPLEPPVGGDDHVGESDALQRADDAEARGDQLTVASWLISAALLSDSTERADNHLRLSARRLLGALDVAGAAVVCSCPEQWLFVGDWTYLLGRVAALQGNSANAIHLFDVAWNKVSTNESAAAAGSELGEPLGVLPEVASHALAVSLASGDSDSLALWVERSRPFQQGSAVSNDDVDTASRIRIASIVAGTHDYEATELRPCAPLDGALGEAVTAHLIGDVDRAIGLIDDDLVVAAQHGVATS